MDRKEEAAEGLRGLIGAMRTYVDVLKLSNPGAEVKCNVAAYNADGTGQIGPSWDYEPFLADIIALVGDPDEEEVGRALEEVVHVIHLRED